MRDVRHGVRGEVGLHGGVREREIGERPLAGRESYTQASGVACALAKLYRRDGVRTVIGGPHARAFPRDCLRFFDVVVGDCDRSLALDIAAGAVDTGSFVASRAPFTDVPSVEERMPELRVAVFAGGRWPSFATTIPLLASLGCPYACDFCTD